MVDVVNVGLAIDKADEILDNLDNVLLGEHTHIVARVKVQLAVNAEAAHIAQIITLLAEEQVHDHLAGCCIIGWLGVAQLPVDVDDGFFL